MLKKLFLGIFVGVFGFVFFAQASIVKMEKIWDSSGDNQMGSYFGDSVASAGDVNNDGFDDVIIGASNYNTSHQGAGKAFLYLGSASGLLTVSSWTSSGSDEEYSYYGSSVASAGDVNHDGFGDVIVSQGYSFANMKPGKVYLYLGSASGLNYAPFQILSEGVAGAAYGRSISSAGDINGDGFSDVIIGSPGESVSHGLAGKAYLYLGSSSGLSLAWTSSGDDEEYASYGSAVAQAGDVNNDGFSDVIVSALYGTSFNPKPGKVYLYLGSTSGLSATPTWVSADGIYSGFFGSSYYGADLSSVGDVNGDGFDDIIVGAQNNDSSENDQVGRAYLYLGNATGLGVTASWQASGYDQADAWYGSSFSFGDINGDGFSDVGVGASGYDTLTVPNAGVVYLYMGNKNGLSTNSSWTFFGDQNNVSGSIFSVGDVNGDGVSNVAVANSSFNQGVGKVSIYTSKPVFSVIINSGAKYTVSRKVNLSLSAVVEGTPYQMIISEKSNFLGVNWKNFDTSKSFKLSKKQGKKIIYAKFRDEAGVESKVVSDTIRYVKNPKFVTKSAKKKNEILANKKNNKYIARDFYLLFKKYPSKLKKKKRYIKVELLKKYPKNYVDAKKILLKKNWLITTDLYKYKANNKFKIKFVFKYTSKEWKALKKKNKNLKEKELTLKLYNNTTKKWENWSGVKHNLKKNTFGANITSFTNKKILFAIGKNID